MSVLSAGPKIDSSRLKTSTIDSRHGVLPGRFDRIVPLTIATEEHSPRPNAAQQARACAHQRHVGRSTTSAARVRRDSWRWSCPSIGRKPTPVGKPFICPVFACTCGKSKRILAVIEITSTDILRRFLTRRASMKVMLTVCPTPGIRSPGSPLFQKTRRASAFSAIERPVPPCSAGGASSCRCLPSRPSAPALHRRIV